MPFVFCLWCVVAGAAAGAARATVGYLGDIGLEKFKFGHWIRTVVICTLGGAFAGFLLGDVELAVIAALGGEEAIRNLTSHKIKAKEKKIAKAEADKTYY